MCVTLGGLESFDSLRLVHFDTAEKELAETPRTAISRYDIGIPNVHV